MTLGGDAQVIAVVEELGIVSVVKVDRVFEEAMGVVVGLGEAALAIEGRVAAEEEAVEGDAVEILVAEVDVAHRGVVVDSEVECEEAKKFSLNHIGTRACFLLREEKTA